MILIRTRSRDLDLPTSRSRSNVVQGALETYATVKRTMEDPAGPCNLREALDKLNMADRTFRRRSSIAELHEIDPGKLKTIIDGMMNRRNGRLPLEKLNDKCHNLIMETSALRTRRAAAIACGRLI